MRSEEGKHEWLIYFLIIKMYSIFDVNYKHLGVTDRLFDITNCKETFIFIHKRIISNFTLKT